MAVISTPSIQKSSLLTQMDLQKYLDPKGRVHNVAEVLDQTNEVVHDIVYKEGNLPNGDEQSIRIGLPKVYWRQYNRGVPSGKSATAMITETTAQLAARFTCDKDLLALNGNSAEYRAKEEHPIIESMTQSLVYELFYGKKKTEADGFEGFTSRYSDSTALNAKNIISAGGEANASGDTGLTSVWIVGWGDNVYCPYPKGTPVGLQVVDRGTELIDDDEGNPFEAYVTLYKWNVGLMVRDWRYVVRIPNVKPADLVAGSGTGKADIRDSGQNLILLLQQALTKIPRHNRGALRIYMNSDVHWGLNVLSSRMNMEVIKFQDASNEYGQTQGTWSTFMGIPIRQVDQLMNNETAYVAS